MDIVVTDFFVAFGLSLVLVVPSFYAVSIAIKSIEELVKSRRRHICRLDGRLPERIRNRDGL